jgi:myosin heavy subunit
MKTRHRKQKQRKQTKRGGGTDFQHGKWVSTSQSADSNSNHSQYSSAEATFLNRLGIIKRGGTIILTVRDIEYQYGSKPELLRDYETIRSKLDEMMDKEDVKVAFYDVSLVMQSLRTAVEKRREDLKGYPPDTEIYKRHEDSIELVSDLLVNLEEHIKIYTKEEKEEKPENPKTKHEENASNILEIEKELKPLLESFNPDYELIIKVYKETEVFIATLEKENKITGMNDAAIQALKDMNQRKKHLYEDSTRMGDIYKKILQLKGKLESLEENKQKLRKEAEQEYREAKRAQEAEAEAQRAQEAAKKAQEAPKELQKDRKQKGKTKKRESNKEEEEKILAEAIQANQAVSNTAMDVSSKEKKKTIQEIREEKANAAQIEDLKKKLTPSYVDEYIRLHSLLVSSAPFIQTLLRDDFVFLGDLITSHGPPKEIDRKLGIKLTEVKEKLATIDEYERLYHLLQKQDTHIKQAMHDDFSFLLHLVTSTTLPPAETNKQLAIKVKEVSEKMDGLLKPIVQKNIKLLHEKARQRVTIFFSDYSKMKEPPQFFTAIYNHLNDLLSSTPFEPDKISVTIVDYFNKID